MSISLERALELKKQEIAEKEKKLEELKKQLSVLEQALSILGDSDNSANEDKTSNQSASQEMSDPSAISKKISLSEIKVTDWDNVIGFFYKGKFCSSTTNTILVDLTKILDKEDPFVLEDIALFDYVSSTNRVLFTLNSSHLIKPVLIRDGIFIETQFSLEKLPIVISDILKTFDTVDFRIAVK